jgi:hypothetical protein
MKRVLSLAASVAPPRGRQSAVGAIALRVRGILTWKHWAWATAVGLLVAASVPFQNFDVNSHWALWRILYEAPWFILFGYVFVIAIAIAEATAPGLRPTVARYAVAAIAAGLVCIAMSGVFVDFVQRAPGRIVEGRDDLPPTNINRENNRRYMVMVGLGREGALHGCLAMFIYVWLRNARLAARAHSEAEIERSEAQRRLIAAQLVAAQAQIDPLFVLKALDDIEQAYEADAARANLMLDEFIAFLRDAIPRLRADELSPPSIRQLRQI